MSKLNKQLSIWITDDQLGTVRTLRHGGRSVQYRVPASIEDQITLRFQGRGKAEGGETGDLLLLIRVDRGMNRAATLWISQTEARAGCEKTFLSEGQELFASLPPGSENGQIVRHKNGGKKLPYQWGLPIFRRKRGDLLVTLRVFPDTIVPNYRDVERLTTQDLYTEGWIYRRSDEVLSKLKRSPHALKPFTAVEAAKLFNLSGWQGIAEALRSRFGLEFSSVRFETSDSLPVPGQCRTEVGGRYGNFHHTILIRSDFLNDPFAITAILAHELCHVIELRDFRWQTATIQLAGPELLEMEQTVDLLVFLFQLGEFQIRVSRDSRMTLGYFNQELFERMYVILSRKRANYNSKPK